MKVAVLSLCRDRLNYTRHCFRTLNQRAGCEFDHFVCDQGSKDGTPRWLLNRDLAGLVLSPDNIGIHRGHNTLLDLAFNTGDYDVVATVDNDCEVVMDGTLAAAARVAYRGDWIVSPTVLGLNHPPRPGEEFDVDGARVGLYWEIGGIFRVMPGWFAREFRFNESDPVWGRDEAAVGHAAKARGLRVGYLLDWHVWHYETTNGQVERFPEYFQRRVLEGGRAS